MKISISRQTNKIPPRPEFHFGLAIERESVTRMPVFSGKRVFG